MDHKFTTSRGKAYPIGATCTEKGVNFCLFSKNATFIELCLFDHNTDSEPVEVFKLTPESNRTFYYWHIHVHGIKAGQLYGYKVHGPNDPKNGYLFDGEKLLLDPYARGIVSDTYDRQRAKQPGNNTAFAMKSVVVNPDDYDWKDDRPIGRPYSESVIYEMHVKGFTAHESSGVSEKNRGTYAGVIEKIPYLKEMGITAVELMPVQQFDNQDAMPGLTNYWGYSPIGFFAPHNGYSKHKNPLNIIREFKDMVNALHQAGIEVILDVVFNHTAEGGLDGPVLSYRGIENKAYYITSRKESRYKDYTGCGNTLNANHSIVRRMIMDSLRCWVKEYHIDGFRFDLASVLSRDEHGEPLKNPPVLWEIESDPVLAGTKIIAEAWDAAGLYQVGSFIGDRWAEWNGKYRDHVRRFIKGDPNMVSKFASKIIGSPDIYTQPNRETDRSIHFVTCHDGFTLNDLVSYNDKHNLANKEKNRDGNNNNFSWNCGVEGESDDPEIEALRLRQVKNLLALTFFSQGTPMLLMGDEIRRTQLGNNNAYCQDNDLSWMDWRLLDKNREVFEFTKMLIKMSQSHEIFQIDDLLATPEHIDKPHVIWHGTKPFSPDWGENSHSLAFELQHPEAKESFYVIINAFWKPLKFVVPALTNGHKWYKIIDTSEKFVSNSPSVVISAGDRVTVGDRTILVMIAG